MVGRGGRSGRGRSAVGGRRRDARDEEEQEEEGEGEEREVAEAGMVTVARRMRRRRRNWRRKLPRSRQMVTNIVMDHGLVKVLVGVKKEVVAIGKKSGGLPRTKEGKEGEKVQKISGRRSNYFKGRWRGLAGGVSANVN